MDKDHTFKLQDPVVTNDASRMIALLERIDGHVNAIRGWVTFWSIVLLLPAIFSIIGLVTLVLAGGLGSLMVGLSQ